MSTTKNLKPRWRVKVKVNFRQNIPKQDIARYLYWICSLASQVSEHPPPSHFHLVSIPFQWLFWKDAQARHLSNTTNVSKVSNTTGTPLDSIFISPFRGLEPQTPLPSTRPLLLPCQFHWISSRCSSKSCWLSMLRQGPEDKNNSKPCKTWELTRRSATLTESHVHHQNFEAKITSQSQGEFPPKHTKTRYC